MSRLIGKAELSHVVYLNMTKLTLSVPFPVKQMPSSYKITFYILYPRKFFGVGLLA